MAATYDDLLPTDKDWVRFLVGDRDTTSPVFQDAEILAVITEETGQYDTSTSSQFIKYLAAARMAEQMLSRSRGLTDKGVDDLRLRWGMSNKTTFMEFINSLRQRGIDLIPNNFIFKVL